MTKGYALHLLLCTYHTIAIQDVYHIRWFFL